MIAEINRSQPDVMAALLLETELRRMVHRCPQLSQDMVSSLLTKVSLYLIEPAQFTHAGLLPGQNLRSLDVLHLAAATDLGVDALVTYDQRLQSAAHEIGMSVVAPPEPPMAETRGADVPVPHQPTDPCRANTRDGTSRPALPRPVARLAP